MAAVLVVLMACHPDPRTSPQVFFSTDGRPSSAGDSGVWGGIGAVPPCICPHPAVGLGGRVEVLLVFGDQVVASGRASEQGSFVIPLPPGAYRLSLVSTTSSINVTPIACPRPAGFEVVPERWVRATIQCTY